MCVDDDGVFVDVCVCGGDAGGCGCGSYYFVAEPVVATG